MVTLPWQAFKAPQADREYLAMVSYLPLKRWRDFFRFQRYSGKIRRQLEGTRGVVGYSLRARFTKRQFWTLSVWEDEAALARFIPASPHRHAMTALQPVMGTTKFVKWRVRGADLPIAWDEGTRRLQ